MSPWIDRIFAFSILVLALALVTFVGVLTYFTITTNGAILQSR